MLSAAISVIDRLIQLLKERRENDRNLFKDHIEPMFLDMAAIHQDYLLTFEEKTRTSHISPEVIHELVTTKKRELEHLRVKVHALAREIDAGTLRKFPEAVIEFITTCFSYFSAEAGRTQDYYGQYSELLDFMNEAYITSEPKEHDDIFYYKIAAVTRTVRERWNDVTFAYAKARIKLEAVS
jgi:hypothetical protein